MSSQCCCHHTSRAQYPKPLGQPHQLPPAIDSDWQQKHTRKCNLNIQAQANHYSKQASIRHPSNEAHLAQCNQRNQPRVAHQALKMLDRVQRRVIQLARVRHKQVEKLSTDVSYATHSQAHWVLCGYRPISVRGNCGPAASL